MRPWLVWSALLGFAFGGFFDGILLHQILQWHHLLSGVSGVASLRAQLLWDGLFHALMYLVALVALIGLRRYRARAASIDESLSGAMLVGFGAWHVVDALLSHWVLGIHRIRMDSPTPLLWDLGWLAGFGLAPLALGAALIRGARLSAEARLGRRLPLWLLAAVTIGLAAWSLRPPADRQLVTIVFSPATSPAEAIDAIVTSGGRIAWANPDLSVALADVAPARRLSLYRRGALLVAGQGLIGGCAAWSSRRDDG
jgi:uncharacterized membrane protein